MIENQTVLSPAQVEDGFGAYEDVATQAGLEVTLEAQAVPSPNFVDVAIHITPDEVGPLGAPAAIDVPRSSEAYGVLGQYPGLRVLLGQRVPTNNGGVREVLVPGIVLRTKAPTGYANVGCLTAPPDIVFDPDAAHQHRLNDLQQALLMQTYVMHTEGVGDHAGDGSLNAGDVAHAAVIATTKTNRVQGLHGRTHDMVDAGFTPSLTQEGSLDIAVGHDILPVREDVIGLHEATRVVIVQEDQMPAGELTTLVAAHAGMGAVGLTIAAGKTREDAAVTAASMRHKLETMQLEMSR